MYFYNPIFRIVTFICFLGLSSQSFALGKLSEFKLPNGLNIIIREDHRAPVVVAQFWYHVGSIDEPKGITGISHFLEHMMFQGTPNLSRSEYSQTIEQLGENNAFTAHNATTYYTIFSPEAVDTVLATEADRMQDLSLLPDAFTNERQVILQEWAMRIGSNPWGTAMEKLSAMTYLSSGYHHPVIGWKEDILNINLDQVRSWYKQWYGPNHLTIVIVGDVDPKTILEKAKHYFGNKKETPGKRPHQYEQPPLGNKDLTLKLDVHQNTYFWSFPAPRLSNDPQKKDPLALMLLEEVLINEHIGLLKQALVNQDNIAINTNSSYNPLQWVDGYFTISITPKTGIRFATMDRKLKQVLFNITKNQIDPKRLMQAKKAIISSYIYSQDSLVKQAQILGALATVGIPPPARYDSFAKDIMDISQQDVLRSLNQYFTPTTPTITMTIEPK